MKRINIICALLAIVGTIAVAMQRQSLAKLRAGSHRGFTNEVVNDSPAGTGAAHEEEIISLREQTRELARLRNEISRLRTARGELASARSESTRLLEAKQNAAPAPAPPPGFISREQLTNAGFATPEATLQTFFWAMNTGDLETTLQTLSPNNRERKSFDKLSPEQRARAVNENKPRGRDAMMTHFNDFGIRGREEISEGVVVLHVGSSLSTNTMRMFLQRFGEEWRLQEFPR